MRPNKYTNTHGYDCYSKSNQNLILQVSRSICDSQGIVAKPEFIPIETVTKLVKYHFIIKKSESDVASSE